MKPPSLRITVRGGRGVGKTYIIDKIEAMLKADGETYSVTAKGCGTIRNWTGGPVRVEIVEEDGSL